ncbi:MAG: methionyl-tRNA formyltransferase [Patescibacteria group bacterium]|nr:methionyl-tRNA formyltransferase [Patescibacteria group bacterium]
MVESTKPLRVIFMATPAFTLPVFEVLTQDKRFEIIAVYTQPDKPAGRHAIPLPPAVKLRASRHDIPVFQPEKFNNPTTIRQIELLEPDIILVFAYSHFLPKEVLAIPKFGCVNIHPSLLPRWRGPSPVAFAILNGDKETGVTFMLMNERMDQGPVILRFRAPIAPADNREDLTARLSVLAAERLPSVLIDWTEGKIKAQPQEENNATYSKLLSRPDGRIDWKKTAVEIERQIRAFSPWPGAFCSWGGKQLKILKSSIDSTATLPPGQARIANKNLIVGTARQDIKILALQPEGKKPMNIKDFLNGGPKIDGSILS